MPETMFLIEPLPGAVSTTLAGSAGVEVLRQAGLVTPGAGIVDDDRVFDAVGGVVDLRGILRR